jgi:hypothetical protein
MKKRIADMEPGTVFKSRYSGNLCVVAKICFQINPSLKPYLNLENFNLYIDVYDDDDYEIIGCIGADGRMEEVEG